MLVLISSCSILRRLSVTQPGNTGTTAYVYEGNTVKVTDPAGKWKKYTSDAVGNLVQVTEPDPGGEVQTYYTYNLRNQLTLVSMPRGATTQARTFNYDLTTGRLTSAANPENGTVSYTYNADGTVATRTDALNQQVRYTYDSYGRVTTVRRYNSSGVEQTCQKVTNTFDGAYNGWGRLSSVSWGGSSCTGGSWSQSYRYTTAGRSTQKTQTGGGFTLTANYTYDNEGKMLTAQYPSSGPTFTYTYDTLARPIKLTDNQATPVDWVKDVLYNAAGRITQMKYTQTTNGSSYYTETRTFSVLQQLTRLTVPGVLDQEYRFSDTQNDGRITQRKDWISGEEVGYQYDSLNRLISAVTTGPQWGQSFSYDGFGNMLAQTVTKGTAPALSVNVNPATNRITTGGYSYDANGNLTAMPLLTMSYDVENRLAQATSSLDGADQYVYDPQGRRVWKNQTGSQGPSWTTYFYGVDGNLLGRYESRYVSYYYVYFGRKLIYSQIGPAGPVVEDRLASTVNHFPYGEEPYTTQQNRTKFATYFRDQTTALDYAQNRYYARTIGRFTSPDPYRASGGPADPQSWNRYAYVENDPVNSNDPSGLFLNFLWDELQSAGGFIGSLFGWQPQPDRSPDYDSWMAGWDMLEKLQPDPTSYGIGMQITYSDGQTQDLGFNTHPFDQEKTPPVKEASPPTEIGLPNIPWAGSVVIPFPPVPEIGFQVSFTKIPNTPKGNRLCLGLGPAVGFPAAYGVSGGPLLIGDGTDAESVVGGFGWSSYGQPGPVAGVQLISSTAGQVWGPTGGMRGATLSAGFTACMPMPRLPSWIGGSARTR